METHWITCSHASFWEMLTFCETLNWKHVIWLTASYWEGILICRSRAKGLKGAHWWPPAKLGLLLKWLSMLWSCALDSVGKRQRLLHMCDEKHHSERSVSTSPFQWDVWTVLSIKDRHGISLNSACSVISNPHEKTSLSLSHTWFSFMFSLTRTDVPFCTGFATVLSAPTSRECCFIQVFKFWLGVWRHHWCQRSCAKMQKKKEKRKKALYISWIASL